MTRRMLAAAAAIAASTIVLSGQAAERVMVVSVVDGRGNPATGLTEKDFVVREDGMAREILRVVRDEEPLQVALLVDNGANMREQLSHLRTAVSSFVRELRPGVQLSIVTLAERPTIVAGYTSDKTELLAAVGRIVTYNAGTYLLDGIAETAQGLAARRGARPVIAAVVTRGLEMSHREYTDVLRIVAESGTPAVHVLTTGGINLENDLPRGLSGAQQAVAIESRQNTEREIALARLTRETGGRHEDVLSMSALPMKLRQVAAELSNQYRVTFARPSRLVPPEKTEVAARDSSLKARGRLLP